MYHGCNENKHVKIIEKLLKLGADPNAHDLIGNTPLFYAAHFRYEADKVVSLLLRHGADPNYSGQCTSIFYHMCSAFASEPEHWSLIDLLMSYNAKPKDYEEAMQIRWGMETQYSLEYAVKMRESYPKKKNECERTECEISAVKMCKACRSVVYCTPACQKLDWKFHKPTCMKKRQEKELKNSA